ncbi:hypothetical protein BHE74_00046247 [Ensete ventricosum]|nr:hypothetical protein BHE74_00046247 [Ensete ventricosum]
MVVSSAPVKRLMVVCVHAAPYGKIENEYNNVARAFEGGSKYIQWAGNMAVGLDAGVPWVMCKQNDAPGTGCSVIHHLRGQQRILRTPLHASSQRTARSRTTTWYGELLLPRENDVGRQRHLLTFPPSFSVQYHGGTNFGRTGAAFMMTRYYDEAPLDEYGRQADSWEASIWVCRHRTDTRSFLHADPGMQKEPKWGHLKDLHHALNLCRKGLLWGTPSIQTFDHGFEVRRKIKQALSAIRFKRSINLRS